MAKDTSLRILFSCMLVILSSCAGYRSTILPRVAVTEEYTDNRDLSNRNQESDFRTTVTPGMTYQLASSNKQLTFSCDPSFTYDPQSSGSFVTEQTAALNASNQFSRFSRIEMNDAFTRTDDPSPFRQPTFTRPDEPPPPPDTTIRRNREPYYTNTTNVRYRYQFGPSDLLYFDYGWAVLINEDPTVEDNSRHSPSMGLTYWFTPLYGLETTTSYTRGDFSQTTPSINELNTTVRVLRKMTRTLDAFIQYSHTQEDFEGDTPDYRVYDISGGVDYHLSRTTFLTMSAGYFYQDVSQGEPASGYSLSGDMAKEFSRGAVRLSGGTGYAESFFGAQNLGFTKYYIASLAGQYKFLRRLSGEISGTYQINSYTDVAGREDTLITAGASLNYLVRPWLSAGLSFVHHTSDSSAPGDSYDENRITLSITVVPVLPIRLK